MPIGPFADLSFDSTGLVYTLTGFGGAEDSSLQPDPTNAANTAVRVNRAANAETFAGTVVSTGPSLTAGTIPFTATNTRMSVRVYSPAAGIRVRLKVESAQDTSRSVETEAVTTVANAWETLTFDFANQVSGTPALNPSYNYNRIIIFFDFGQAGVGHRRAHVLLRRRAVRAGGGGGGGGAIVFASGYASNNRTVEGGEWGFYSGNFTNYSNTYAGGGFVDGAGAVPPADSLCLPGRRHVAADDGRLHGHLHRGAGLHHRGPERGRDAQWPDEPEDRARHGCGVVPAGHQQGS